MRGVHLAVDASTADLASVSHRAHDAIAGTPVSARIDVAGVDGHWIVMELEFVEPELFFRVHPVLAEEFADVVVPLVG